MRFNWIWLIGVLIIVFGCTNDNSRIANIKIDLSDVSNLDVIDLQDRRDSKGLAPLLRSNRPQRLLAVRALASVQDTSLLDSLKQKLDDPNEIIRIEAAYAIGQLKWGKAIPVLIKAFTRDTTDVNTMKYILEAVGKCGSEEDLANLASIQSYEPRDIALVEGQTLGLYRFLLRGMTTEAGTKSMVEVATNMRYSQPARLMAAHYLSRSTSLDLTEYTNKLVPAYYTETDPYVRMAMGLSYRNSNHPSIPESLSKMFDWETDARNKMNLLRSATYQKFEQVRDLLFKGLKSEDPQIAKLAARYFGQIGNRTMLRKLFNYRDSIKDEGVKIQLNRSLLKHNSQKLSLTNTMTRQLKNTENPYEKAAILEALSENGYSLPIIYQNSFFSEHEVVRSAGMNAIVNILDRPNFYGYFGDNAKSLRRSINYYLKQAILSKDPAMIAIAAGALQDENKRFKRIFRDFSFLKAAQDSLSLPKEIETWLVLEETIAFFEDRPISPANKTFNHPINREILSKLTSQPKVLMELEKGTVEMELYPNKAPGSVVNFIELIEKEYYNEKTVHRVVSNFVIQGGCPRGDGWGNEDYTIRSEFGQNYYNAEGYLGMASAGKDTEGTQWFITHSPTPHLDGLYTIFGKVVKGMDVVLQTQVGDRIKKVSVSY